MLIKRNFIAILALVLTSCLNSQAQPGAMSPKPGNVGVNQDDQADVDQPFFDNRKNHSKPKKDKPAPSKVILYKPVYSGTGCPAGSAGVAMTTDNRAVSIVFNQFTTEAGAGANKQTTEKNCEIIIPIEAPAGYRMAVAQMDYRGFKSIPNKARGKLVAVHRIRHELKKVVGPRVRSVQVFEGPNSEDFFMSANIETKPLGPNAIANTCGGIYNLEIDAKIMVMTNPTGEQAMIMLDSLDGSVAYHLQWEQCK
ncbi:hypothetical protein CIK05_14785 [Bdellovibrio sp. qaytius]|nr:hypothetical protein CIK05_14785 [Bdellovibrio sp. qaytius]